MRRHTARMIRVFAIGGVCAGLIGVRGMVRADAPKTKVEKPERIGWGETRDGLQIGLFPQKQQKLFHYGDTLSLVMRVRNTGKSPIDLTMKQPNISYVTLGESGRLVLQTLGGGSGSATPLRLAPGETRELPGGRYAASIIAPGETKEPTKTAALTLALLPGVYHAECDYPIWMPDQNDANRATAHRAKPGIFTFEVQKDASRQPAEGKAENVADAAILWGEPVNGLQGGVRRITDMDLASLPADQRKGIAADEILTWFYLRNTTNKPLRVSFHNFEEYDASFWVKDAQGNDLPVHSVFFTGLRALEEQTLQPGDVVHAGTGRLKFQTKETPQRENSATPLLTAKPGAYSLRLISSVRFAGLNSFDMVLVSAALPFNVTQP